MMNTASANPHKSADAFTNQFALLADDAAFLWLLRGIAVNQAHYNPEDIRKIENRIDAALDSLMTAPEESWLLCAAALQLQQPGEVFAAAVLAFRSLDIDKIQQAVVAGLSSEETFSGLVAALAWLPGKLVHSWIKKFLTSKDLNHKYLALAACSLRREDPQQYLTAIFQRADCLAHSKLYARSLRLIGELKRRDLSAALPIALKSGNPEIVFWASWSGVILGDKSYIQHLRPYALNTGAYQTKAIDLAFRSLPMLEARSWINELAKSPGHIRKVISATATLGDPHTVNWLIAQMRIPALTRLAGGAFTTITGIDLEEHKLALNDRPNLDEYFPNEDAADTNVDINEDDRLPFPDVDKVAAVWQQYQQRFLPGQRYFMGKLVNAESREHLRYIYNNGYQRQRRAAAMELALLDPQQFLFNYAAKDTAPYE